MLESVRSQNRDALRGSLWRRFLWPFLSAISIGGATAFVTPWGAALAGLMAGGGALYLVLHLEANSSANLWQQRLLEKYTDSLPGMIYQCRLYPNFRCVITYANKALAWIYETDLVDMQKDCRSIFELVHPDDKERIWNALRVSCVSLTPWTGEYRVVLPRQGVRWRFAQAEVERLVDGSTLWNGYVADITWRKENEERLREAERNEASALRAARDSATASAGEKETFLAEMSHEIRTPLGSIIGYSELIKDMPLNPTQREYLTTIERCAERLLSMVNETLDQAKIESGQFQLACREFALRDCIEQTFKTLQPQALEKGLDFTCQVEESVPRVAQGDQLRIEQVIINLVGNAIKYTPQGAVRLTAEALEPHSDPVTIRIGVEDTGRGIPEGDREKIFSPYMQVGEQGHGSTGLGLAITRKICELMGGGLTVNSEIGKGSRFVAEIRLAPSCDPSKPLKRVSIN